MRLWTDMFKFVNNLKIRWKMTVVVLPLVLIPIFVVGTVVGWIAYRQAHLGITQTSMDDLDHLAASPSPSTSSTPITSSLRLIRKTRKRRPNRNWQA